MKQNLFPLLLILLAMASCHRSARVVGVSTEAIVIDSLLDECCDSAYLHELEPITAALDSQLNVVVGYAPQALTVCQPECNMLNWASDALLAKARQYYPGTVDFSVVNIGGMRTNWPAGNITRRQVFELMPFDNQLVVLTLSGEDVLELCQVFVEAGGQGVSGLRLIAEDRQVAEVTINGREVEPDRYYHVAISDYLAGGTDHMTPLTHATNRWDSDRLIRDLYIDYIMERCDVKAEVDGRMTIQ